MKRPKDMTAAELSALPVGPFVMNERPITEAEYDAGIRGRSIVTHEYPPVKIVHYGDDDILSWSDGEYLWRFGQWGDGRWFKEIVA